MAINLNDGFEIGTNIPVDSRFIVATLAARDAIDPLVRYRGMSTHVYEDDTTYRLIGGIDNANWEEDGGGGGGGGLALIWRPSDSSLAPIETYVNGVKVVLWNDTDLQSLFAQIQVPASYKAGIQIFVKGLKLYSLTATTGDVRLRTTTKLLKTGSDITTLSEHIAATATVNVPATVNEVFEGNDLDLTDALGEVDGEAVAPGDVLIITLLRDQPNETSTATGDIGLFIDALYPTFK
jgi:hypothetical protein